MSAPLPARLLSVHDFADAMWPYPVRESEATLMLTGRLTRVTVGRRSYYLRDDVDRLRSGGTVEGIRHRLWTLANRALSFPNMTVDDEVAALSVLPRDGALLAFDDLCTAVADGDADAAETVLDLLTGRLR